MIWTIKYKENLVSICPIHSPKSLFLFQFEKAQLGGSQLAQSIQHKTLDFGVVCSSFTLGVALTLKKY